MPGISIFFYRKDKEMFTKVREETHGTSINIFNLHYVEGEQQ